MKKTLSSIVVGTAVGAALGLAACDGAAPTPAPSAPSTTSDAAAAESPAIAALRAQLAAIVRDQDLYSRMQKLSALLPTLGPDAVPAVKKTLEDRTVELKSSDYDLLVRFWASHEPEAATNWAVSMAPLIYKLVSVQSAVWAWAQTNPESAVKGAWPLVDIPGLELVVPGAIVRGWFARGNPPELQDFLLNTPPDVMGQRAIVAYIRALLETEDSEAVKAWAESIPDIGADSRYKVAVFSRAVDMLSQLDIAAAIAWCEVHCYGRYGKNMRDVISRNWALTDGPAAMQWLSTARPGTQRDIAVRLTYGQWGSMRRDEAVAWMAEQTASGEVPDWLRAAIPIYAGLLSQKTPLEAIRWTAQIADPLEREQVLVSVLRAWRGQDDAAVEQWLLTAGLPEKTLEKVRAPLPRALNLPPGVQVPGS